MTLRRSPPPALRLCWLLRDRAARTPREPRVERACLERPLGTCVVSGRDRRTRLRPSGERRDWPESQVAWLALVVLRRQGTSGVPDPPSACLPSRRRIVGKACASTRRSPRDSGNGEPRGQAPATVVGRRGVLRAPRDRPPDGREPAGTPRSRHGDLLRVRWQSRQRADGRDTGPPPGARRSRRHRRKRKGSYSRLEPPHPCRRRSSRERLLPSGSVRSFQHPRGQQRPNLLSYLVHRRLCRDTRR